MAAIFSLSPDDSCPDEECKGTMKEKPSENCSCHINPPCSACMNAGLVCDKCGFEHTYTY